MQAGVLSLLVPKACLRIGVWALLSFDAVSFHETPPVARVAVTSTCAGCRLHLHLHLQY